MSKELIKAVTAATTSVLGDVYRDAAQPSVRRVGVSIEALVKIGLSPVALMDWGFERSKDWLKAKIQERLERIPPECVVEPTAGIAYAAVSHVATSSDVPELRELYAELLLKALDSRTSASVHPAYFYIVEQLAAPEALVLVGLHQLARVDLFSEEVTPYSHVVTSEARPSVDKQFASFCQSILTGEADQAAIWLTNLCRLGLLNLRTYAEAIFRPEEHDRHGYREAAVDNHEHRSIEFTEFGKAFITACAPP